jgi:hypothetical protein
MPTVVEPIGAGLAVALINKFIINNPSLWMFICGCGEPQHNNDQDESHENSISSSATVNDVELHVHHTF